MKRNGFIVFLIMLVIMAVFQNIFLYMNFYNDGFFQSFSYQTPKYWIVSSFDLRFIIYCVIYSLLPAFCVTLTWMTIKLIHPLSLAMLCVFTTFITRYTSIYLIFLQKRHIFIEYFVEYMLSFSYFTLSFMMASFPICWLSKQLFDEKGRDFSLNIKDSDKPRLKFVCLSVCFSLCFLSIMLFTYSIDFWYPRRFLPIVENDPRYVTMQFTKKLYFIIPIFAYLYLLFELFRKGKITMVKFTRVGILVHIAYVLLIFLLMIFVYHQYDEIIRNYQETGKIQGYIVSQVISLFFYTACYTSVSFSLPFWITGKFLQAINRFGSRRINIFENKNNTESSVL